MRWLDSYSSQHPQAPNHPQPGRRRHVRATAATCLLSSAALHFVDLRASSSLPSHSITNRQPGPVPPPAPVAGTCRLLRCAGEPPDRPRGWPAANWLQPRVIPHQTCTYMGKNQPAPRRCAAPCAPVHVRHPRTMQTHGRAGPSPTCSCSGRLSASEASRRASSSGMRLTCRERGEEASEERQCVRRHMLVDGAIPAAASRAAHIQKNSMCERLTFNRPAVPQLCCRILSARANGSLHYYDHKQTARPCPPPAPAAGTCQILRCAGAPPARPRGWPAANQARTTVMSDTASGHMLGLWDD